VSVSIYTMAWRCLVHYDLWHEMDGNDRRGRSYFCIIMPLGQILISINTQCALLQTCNKNSASVTKWKAS